MDNKCHYCGNELDIVEASTIIKKAKVQYLLYCNSCGAHVSCHPDATPMGIVANAELRTLRYKIHNIMDPLWERGCYERAQLYQYLSNIMGFDVHIGSCDIDQCKKLLRYVVDLINK